MIKKIVILGADSIGWSAATGLARGLQGQADITVVPTLQEQEPSYYFANHHIFDYHHALGINSEYLINHQGMLLQSAIGLIHDGKDEQRIIGTNGYLPVLKGMEIHQLCKYLGLRDTSPYSYAAQAAIANKRVELEKIEGFLQASCQLASQINTNIYANFMKGAALKSGVTFRSEPVKKCILNEQTGFITSVLLRDGTSLDVDLIIDNSGAQKLAASTVLHETKESQVSKTFDTLIEIRRIKPIQAKPITKITATEWGILSQISASGAHYYQLYCNTSQKEKQNMSKEILAYLGLDPEDVKIIFIDIKTHYSSRYFYKNCVVIGTAAGASQSPLVSPLILAQRAVTRLLDLFPCKECFDSNSLEFDRLTAEDFNEAYDYQTLINTVSAQFARQIGDELYWCPSPTSISTNLKQRMALFKVYGRFEDKINQIFTRQEWLEWLNIAYECHDNCDPLLAILSKQDIDLFLRKLSQDIQTEINRLPVIA